VTPPAKRVEVQFVIERKCPHSPRANEKFEGKFRALLPFAAWIYWPPEPNVFHDCDTSLVYRVSRKGEKELEKLFRMKMLNGHSCLCEHMGHVIE
jgi:hypothetical protein